jgi:hypothetical protein
VPALDRARHDASRRIGLARDDDDHPLAWVQYGRERIDDVWRILATQPA